MSLIILDLGSGNTCRNDPAYARLMVDTVIGMLNEKTRHVMAFKWQLEKDDPPGQKKLDREVFREVHEYTRRRGFASGSSVFDIESLNFLLGCNPAFVKIACRPELYQLNIFIPWWITRFVSVDGTTPPVIPGEAARLFLCIPKYPATLEEYETRGYCAVAVSDHTRGLELWNKYHPRIIEKHFVLERDKDNPDAGVFALDPDQLKEMIA